MDPNPFNQNFSEIIAKYDIKMHSYLNIYYNLEKIFEDDKLSQDLLTYNNQSVKYPLAHYLFLIEYELFYQSRRSSLIINPLLQKIHSIRRTTCTSFPEWFFNIIINSIGYYYFVKKCTPIVDQINNKIKDWKKLYNLFFHNKEHLNIFQVFLDNLFLPSNLREKVNIMEISYHFKLICLDIHYSLMSYGINGNGVNNLFKLKDIEWDDLNNDLFEPTKSNSVWNKELLFGPDHNMKYYSFYDKITGEKIMNFTSISDKPIIITNKSINFTIPLKKMIKYVPEFEVIKDFLENKQFITYFNDIVKKDNTTVPLDETDESNIVRNIYAKFFNEESLDFLKI